ncbi:endonuclease/exonuclease/phosphatase family protein [Candidatus Microgenomates bacterium]|nr:endonuclease/exonuclease/phosphatase family protein [Candidatus Microgenomates bacterium]
MKLITLNIEGDRHLETVMPFLQNENADMVCLQEVFEDTVPRFRDTLHATESQYIPSSIYRGKKWGIATFSKIPFQSKEQELYFVPDAQHLLEWCDIEAPEQMNEKMRRAFTVAEITIEGQSFTVINTHFTWSTGGENTPLQERVLQVLMWKIQKYGEVLLCGDFNIPRGSRLRDRIAATYHENIPADVESTLDPHLHKAKGHKSVVDGIFSSPSYEVSEVRVVSGVSDHCAIVATISRHV